MVKTILFFIILHLFSINLLLSQVTIKPGLDFHFFEDNLSPRASKFQWRPNLIGKYKINRFSVNTKLSAYASITARFPAWDIDQFEFNRFIDIRYKIGRSIIGAGYYNRLYSDLFTSVYVYTDFKEYGGYIVYERSISNVNFELYFKLDIESYFGGPGIGHMFHISLNPNTDYSGDKKNAESPFKLLIGASTNSNLSSSLRINVGISFSPQIGIEYSIKKSNFGLFVAKSSDLYIKHTFSEVVTLGKDTVQYSSLINNYAKSTLLGIICETPIEIYKDKIKVSIAAYSQKIDLIDSKKLFLYGYNSTVQSTGIKISTIIPTASTASFIITKNFPFNGEELKQNELEFFSNLHLGLLWEL